MNAPSLRSLKFASPIAALFALGLPVTGSQLGCATVLDIPTRTLEDPAARTCTGTLKVGISSDWSSTSQSVALPFSYGIWDYLQSLNTSGGIKGCPIEALVGNGEYDAAATEALVKTWSKRPDWADVNTLFVFGTGPTDRLYENPALPGNRIVIPGSYAGKFTSPVPVKKSVTYGTLNSSFALVESGETKESQGYPNVFFPVTDYSTAIRLGMSYIANQQGGGRIGFAQCTTTAFCTEPLAAAKSYLPSLNNVAVGRDLEIPLSLPSTSPDTDLAAHISRVVDDYLMQEQAQVTKDATYSPVAWLWSGNTLASSTLFAKAVAAYVRKPTVTLPNATAPVANMYYTAAAGHRPLHIMSNNWGMGESSAAACPDCKGILFGIFPVPRYGDSDAAAGMAAAQGIHDGYGTTSFANNAVPPSPVRTIDMYKDVRYIQGHAAALMWARGVELAVTQMAGSKPTAAEIKVALESFRSERLFGMTTGPVSFSATDHRPQTEAWIYQLESVGVGGQLGLVAAKKVSMSTITDWIGW